MVDSDNFAQISGFRHLVHLLSDFTQCQTLFTPPSWIQPVWTKKNFNHSIWLNFDDGSHLEFCHLGFSHFAQKHFTHTFWINLMIAAILNSANLDSAILNKKKLHSFILTQLDDVRPSWILPSWIQPFFTKKNFTYIILTQLDDGSHLKLFHVWNPALPSWIQTPCYLLSDSLKNTRMPLWLWLKLIQSDSDSFILT